MYERNAIQLWTIHQNDNEFFFIYLKALSGAHSNAEEARRNAQEAQEKYAEQASKDADAIRRKANDTKTAAHGLRGEADHLNGRVVATEKRISKFENLAQKDDGLTQEAKERVNINHWQRSYSATDIKSSFNSIFSGGSSSIRLQRGEEPGRQGHQRGERYHGRIGRFAWHWCRRPRCTR